MGAVALRQHASDPALPLGRKSGGANRDRTDDLLHAMQALYQLSYGPISRLKAQQIPPPPCRSNLFYPHSPPLPTLAKGRLGGLPCCR